jgi:hypothetical protein
MSIDPLYGEIGAKIATLRRQWHMPPSELSRRTQLPIGRYEMGLEAIPITALYAIAKALHCKVAWLLPDSEGQG